MPPADPTPDAPDNSPRGQRDTPPRGGGADVTRELSSGAASGAGSASGAGGRGGSGSGGGSAARRALPAGEGPGGSIGPYALLEVIGEGGFGVVYLAERREPMLQRVALKVIKPGMDSAAVVARFEQERQALAVMDHPNVARVLDGGVTPLNSAGGGRPYFVMELVRGEPITDFADSRRMTLRQRLELFIPVCEAVQHAHHKGLIHRDLKPANVLVTEIEGRPTPKVIDFGVAKAVAGAGWAHATHTQSGVVIGTPEYMSPEQVAGELDVDTRSDVYALGVMLYELLTGELPFDPAELRRAAMLEVARVIRDVAPPKPSTRLDQLAGERRTTVAAARGVTRERLASELRRELDWIPLMAVRKERERRYESPQALADDLRRYLERRPLRAAPDSRAYLARKFVRRHRGPVLGAAAVAATLVFGLAGTAWQARESSRQRDAAVLAQKAEERERARADERADAATRAEAAATAARDAERERADQLKQVSEFQSQMLSQIDTTRAGVDLMADVRERFDAALEKAGVPGAERAARADALGRELGFVNATDAAAAMIDRTILKPAVVSIDEQFKDDPATDASLRQALAELYRTIGLYDAALPLQESALATRRRALGEEHPDTLASIASTGFLLQSQGRLADAERYNREAVEKLRRVLGVEHPQTLNAISNMSTVLYAQRRLDEAEPYAREALEVRRRALGAEHRDTLISISNVGSLLEAQGKLADAEPFVREALDIRRRVLGREHPDTINAAGNLGYLLEEQGKRAEAEPYYREAVDTARRVLGEEHPDTLTFINNMGFLLQSQGKLDEAEPYWREALEKRRRVLGDDHPSTLASFNNMGFLLHARSRPDEAEPYFREAMERARRALGEQHPTTLAITANLGRALRDQDRNAETIDLLTPIEPATRKAFTGARARPLAGFLTALARARVALGYDAERFALAEANLLEAHSIYLAASDRGPTHRDTLECVRACIELYTAWHAAEPAKGYGVKAAAWQATLDEAGATERVPGAR